MIDKIFPIVVGLITLAILSLFIAVLFVPDGQKWITDMMISVESFHPDYMPTYIHPLFSDQGFLFNVWR